MIAVTTANAIATITLPDCKPLSLHHIEFGLALRDAGGCCAIEFGGGVEIVAWDARGA